MKAAVTYHVIMYCMCSFLSVTLVCPPIGPPGMVLAAGHKTLSFMCAPELTLSLLKHAGLTVIVSLRIIIKSESFV